MAGDVKPRRRASLLAMAALALLAGKAKAMGPTAPFVPPGNDLQVQPDGAAALPAGTESGLSGVRLKRLPGALIDGQWVPVGGSVRGARLHQVSRRSATLRFPDGHFETLDLYPSAPDPKAATPATPAAPAALPSSAPASSAR